MCLRNILFEFPAVRNSIFVTQSEIERPYSAERDLGMHKSPFSDDLKENECFSGKGVNKLEMYEGVSLFRAF